MNLLYNHKFVVIFFWQDTKECTRPNINRFKNFSEKKTRRSLHEIKKPPHGIDMMII